MLNNVFNAWKKSDEFTLVIKSLWIVVGILVFINLILVIGWSTAPNRLRVYLPPDLSRGSMIQPGEIPKSTVYAFAYQIFTSVNTWTNSGVDDYKKNIVAYKSYFTPSFWKIISDDYGSRIANNELGRMRLVTGVSGMGYEQNQVEILGGGSWLVNLRLKVQESVGGSVVKDVVIDYPLIISRVNESIQVNPWGLAISGYYKEPFRIETNI